MKTIVITGGPCAGKTSALSGVRERLEQAGFAAIVVPEAATDLILSGAAPWTCASVLDFQTRVIALQLEREAEARRLASDLERQGRKVIVVCDRGVCDSHAYLSAGEFSRALVDNGLDETSALARYDAVFHLESVAKGDPDAYTHVNNDARFEDVAEAVEADDRGMRAWEAHPRMHVIGNFLSFQEKADALCAAIGKELGIPELAFSSGAPILVSACLLGEACRYDGATVPCAEVKALGKFHELVPVCPEQLGGLPTPRTPSEIQPDGRVADRAGTDLTDAFEVGARKAVALARQRGCMQAILKSRSPSCGVRQIYDGTFSGNIIPGRGVAAARLADAGIELFDETDLIGAGDDILLRHS